MSAQRLTVRNLALLKDPSLELPKTRSAEDFGEFLELTLERFLDRLRAFEEPLASLVAERNDRRRALRGAIIAAWRLGRKGELDNATRELEAGIREVEQELILISRRHSAKILQGQSWYRLAAWNGVNSRNHMFHAPFELPYKSYRFSTPGAPTLYLGNSVYLCWLECGEPDLDRCFVSRFEIDATGFEFLDLPCSHQAYIAPSTSARSPG